MSILVRKDDYGATLTVTVNDPTNTAIDISTATTRQFIIEKPGGTLLTKTASFVTDGTNGQLIYTFIDGDIDAKGPYKVQARVTDGSTFEYRTEIGEFDAGQILEA